MNINFYNFCKVFYTYLSCLISVLIKIVLQIIKYKKLDLYLSLFSLFGMLLCLHFYTKPEYKH